MTFTPLVSLPDGVDPKSGRWFILDSRQQVLVVEGAIPTTVECPVDITEHHLLGIDGDTPVWAAQAVEYAEIPDDAGWVGLRQLFGVISDAD